MPEDLNLPTVEGIVDMTPVGQGGFAAVYRGHQPAFRRDVAVKVIQRSGLDADDRRRFERECQAMGALSNHPGIVTLYDAGFTADGRPYLVMEYVARGTLHDRLADGGPMTWQEVAALGVRLSGALETAHRGGVLHRDIKPANVLRAEYGDQLADFGIARIQGGHETRSGVITASVAHAAPEILDGEPPSATADVYALGSTLYEALSGRAAFARDTDEGLVPLIRRVVIEPPPDLRPGGVPDPLATVIETSMAKAPGDRYATAEAFGRALQGAQAALGVPVTDLAIGGGAAEPPPEADETRVVPATGVPPVAAAAGGAAATAADPGATIGSPPADPGYDATVVRPAAVHDAPPPDSRSGGSGKAVLIAVGLGAVVALAIGAFVVFGSDDDPDPTSAATTQPPAGSDPVAADPATTVEAGASAPSTAAAQATTEAPAVTEAPVTTEAAAVTEPPVETTPPEPRRNPAGYTYGLYERVEFTPGTAGATVSGGVVTGTVNGYVLGAAAGQTMFLSIGSVEGNASFDLYRTDDALMAVGTFTQVALPATGDYLVVVGSSGGNASYDLSIDIVTPPAGSPEDLAGPQRNPGGYTAYGRYERVTFDPGATGAFVDSSLVPGLPNGFVVGAAAGQFIRLAIDSGGTGIGMELYGPDDTFLGAGDFLEGALPLDGDYLIVVFTIGPDPFLSVEIL